MTSASSAAAASTPPQNVQPSQGAAVTADSPLTFSVQAMQGESVYLSVSTSSATDASGRIGTDQEFAQMTAGADPSTYSYTPPGYTFPGYFMHTPGAYYWQAAYFACDSVTYQCGYQVGPVGEFTIVAQLPSATTLGPSNQTATTARLNGSLNTQGVAGTFYFELGSTTAYGTRSGLGQASASDQPANVYVDFTSLAPASEYHYRIVVSTSAGTTVGQDELLFTAPVDHTDRIPGWIGIQGRGSGFFVNLSDIPDVPSAVRFRSIVDRSALRWGLRDRGIAASPPATSPYQIDGISEVGFATLPSSVLGEDLTWYRRVRIGRRTVCHRVGHHRRCHRTAGRIVHRITDHDVALNNTIPWNFGPWWPDANHFDIESTILHELGHFAGNPHHKPRCVDSPMVEALGPGEFWRSPTEWFEFGCRNSNTRRDLPGLGPTLTRSAGPQLRMLSISRPVPRGWHMGAHPAG